MHRCYSRLFFVAAISATLATATQAAAMEDGKALVTDNKPILTVSMPDIVATRERFAASWLGKQWLHPDLASFRSWVSQEISNLPAFTTNTHPEALWQHSIGMEMTLTDVGRHEPGVVVQLRHAQAAALMVELAGRIPAYDAERRGGMNLVDGHLMVAENSPPPQAIAPLAMQEDVVGRWSPSAIMAMLKRVTQHEPEAALALPIIASLLPEGHFALSMTAQGMHQKLVLSQQPAGLRPVDRKVLAYIPDNCIAFAVVGIDGEAWYQQHRPAILPALAQAMNQPDGKSAEDFAHNMLAGFGFANGISGLASMFTGEVFISVSSGGLIPRLMIGLPRSPQLDQVIQTACMFSGNVMPGEGEIGLVQIQQGRQRMMAGPLSFGRNAEYWFISSDTVLLQDVMDGDITAIDQHPTASSWLATVPSDSAIVSWMDSRPGISSLTGIANLGLGQIERGQFALVLAHALHRLADTASATTAWTSSNADGFTIHGEGSPIIPAPGISMMALVAGIAVPNLLENRLIANESAAASNLKSGIFPAMIQFQAGAYADADQNGIGSYGFIPELSGAEATPSGNMLNLLTPRFNDHAMNGYHFAVYVLDGAGDMVSNPKEREAHPHSGHQRYFVAYAWPVESSQGRRSFAITADGIIYSDILPPGETPAWTALWGKPFVAGDQPVWPPYRR